MKTYDITTIGTSDTYNPGEVAWELPAAVERALDEGYEPALDAEPLYVAEARQRDSELRAALDAAGKVAVWRDSEGLHMRYRDREAVYAGQAVEGCDYQDEFVRSLALRFRDEQ